LVLGPQIVIIYKIINNVKDRPGNVLWTSKLGRHAIKVKHGLVLRNAVMGLDTSDLSC